MIAKFKADLILHFESTSNMTKGYSHDHRTGRLRAAIYSLHTQKTSVFTPGGVSYRTTHGHILGPLVRLPARKKDKNANRPAAAGASGRPLSLRCGNA